jgi:hypothetical protein
MDLFSSGVIGALIGALVSGVVNWRLGMRSNRLQTTVRLLDEWHSGEMRQWRYIAQLCLEAHGDRGLVEVWSMASDEQKHAISNVAHYFEKFSLLYRASYLIGRFARDSMGGPTGFWCHKLLGATDVDAYDGEWRPVLKQLSYLRARFANA